MNQPTVVQFLASTLLAIENCSKRGGMTDVQRKHNKRFEKVMSTAPSGSGIDKGTRYYGCEIERGDVIKIAFQVGFHHMDHNGFYDKWTEHVVVRPSFLGVNVSVTGRDRNDVKDYLLQVYHAWLTSEAPQIPWES